MNYYQYFTAVESLCASVTCEAILAGDKNLLLELPMHVREVCR